MFTLRKDQENSQLINATITEPGPKIVMWHTCVFVQALLFSLMVVMGPLWFPMSAQKQTKGNRKQIHTTPFLMVINSINEKMSMVSICMCMRTVTKQGY